MAEHPWVSARVLAAGRAADSGQKVHNLLVATEHLSQRVKYLAFVDSDARPRPEWLRMLVSRLERPGLGAVTGYRWFTPIRPTVANALVYSMNCDVMSLLTRSSHHLIWGGSWAIRREVFDAIHLRDAWKGTLSDDLVASRLMRQSRLEVRFEPACVVASPMDVSLPEALGFIRRQYLVARLYTFDWWLFSLLAQRSRNAIWLGNLGVLLCGLLTGTPSPWIPIAVSAVLYLVTVYRGALRQDLVKTYFPYWERASRRIRAFDIWANPLVELAHWIGVASAAVGRCVNWRGIRYHVMPGGQVTKIIRNDRLAEQPAEESACTAKRGSIEASPRPLTGEGTALSGLLRKRCQRRSRCCIPSAKMIHSAARLRRRGFSRAPADARRTRWAFRGTAPPAVAAARGSLPGRNSRGCGWPRNRAAPALPCDSSGTRRCNPSVASPSIPAGVKVHRPAHQPALPRPAFHPSARNIARADHHVDGRLARRVHPRQQLAAGISAGG